MLQEVGSDEENKGCLFLRTEDRLNCLTGGNFITLLSLVIFALQIDSNKNFPSLHLLEVISGVIKPHGPVTRQIAIRTLPIFNRYIYSMCEHGNNYEMECGFLLVT